MRANKNSKLGELTVKLITEKYNSLIEDVQTNDHYTRIDLTNRVNCYLCPSCKDLTKTKDVDRGVTPAMISCSWCGDVAHSTFYKDIAPYRLHTKEWYRPSLEEVLEIAASEENTIEHILMGGLVMRDVSEEDKKKNALELLERSREGMLLKEQERFSFELSHVKFQGTPFFERKRPHDNSVISENPKHRNGRYNPVNRNKNKAARKARKQNRR